MKDYVNSKYPDVASLKRKARKRIPRFAFDHNVGGCGEEIGLRRNRADIESEELRENCTDLSVELYGQRYDAPIGIAPIGLQGLMWPKAPEILAWAVADLNIPSVLSTVSSSSLKQIAEVSEGRAWFHALKSHRRNYSAGPNQQSHRGAIPSDGRDCERTHFRFSSS